MTKVFSKKHLVFAIFACCPVVYATGMEHAFFVLLNLARLGGSNFALAMSFLLIN